MIISQTVPVALNGRNLKHFENLGYEIPRYLDKKNRWSFKEGTKIEVKVSDLTKGSNTKILCKCNECGKEFYLSYDNLCRRSNPNICKICCSSLQGQKCKGQTLSKSARKRTNAGEAWECAVGLKGRGYRKRSLSLDQFVVGLGRVWVVGMAFVRLCLTVFTVALSFLPAPTAGVVSALTEPTARTLAAPTTTVHLVRSRSVIHCPFGWNQTPLIYSESRTTIRRQ